MFHHSPHQRPRPTQHSKLHTNKTPTRPKHPNNRRLHRPRHPNPMHHRRPPNRLRTALGNGPRRIRHHSLAGNGCPVRTRHASRTGRSAQPTIPQRRRPHSRFRPDDRRYFDRQRRLRGRQHRRRRIGRGCINWPLPGLAPITWSRLRRPTLLRRLPLGRTVIDRAGFSDEHLFSTDGHVDQTKPECSIRRFCPPGARH